MMPGKNKESKKSIGRNGIGKWGVKPKTGNIMIQCTISRELDEQIRLRLEENGVYYFDRPTLIRTLLREWVEKKKEVSQHE